MDELPKVLGRLIARKRRAKGLSQEKLAELAGVHRTYISQIERGLKSPTVAVLIQISIALGISAGSLLSELEKQLGRIHRQTRFRN